MKMRVVYILNTSSAYGANRSLVSFINYLAGNGVKCFAILPEAGGIEEELKALGVEGLRIRLKNGMLILYIPIVQLMILVL